MTANKEAFEGKLDDNIKWWRNAMNRAKESEDWSNVSECEHYLRGLLWCKQTLKECDKK